MRNELNIEIFHQAFSSRVEIAAALKDALKPSLHDFDRLKAACLNLKATISNLDQGDVENQYRAYCTATAIFVSLAEWMHAIRKKETDAQRFLNAAKLEASEVRSSFDIADNEQLNKFIDDIENLKTADQVTSVQEQLKRWNLPLLLFANVQRSQFQAGRIPGLDDNSEAAEKLQTTVAFLKFNIDGTPAKQWNYLKPGTAYDLTMEVRVSNWPKDARILSLTPVTIDIRESSWLPCFKFERPEGDGPFIFTGTGRAVLEIAHSFGSRPYEFLYAAEFDEKGNYHGVEVVGHRRLLLEGCDIASHPLTGFSNVDRHLLDIRNKLRTFSGVHSDDITNTMIVLGGLGSIAAQALKGGLFEANTLERKFQTKATEMLRNRSDIGEHLQGHQEAAGGVTDLTFQDIPIELKVEYNKVLLPKDFSKFFDQTASYAIGLGKRIAILSILESTQKSAPIGVIEDDIEVINHQVGKSSILIVVVIIRGGFPKPSSYSQ